MKSAHKLGAALATFILLSVGAYFTVVNIHEATLESRAPTPSRPGNENTTATSQPVAATSLATAGISTYASGSNASGSTETPESTTTTTATTTTTTTTTPPPASTQSPMTTTVSSSQVTETTTAAPPLSEGQTRESITTTTPTPVSATVEPVAKSETTSEPASTSNTPPAEQNMGTSALYFEKTRQPLADFPPSPEELEKWAQFKSRYMKAYPDMQAENARMAIFIGNLRFIGAFNSLKDNSFKLDINRFADLTQNETNALFIGPQHKPVPSSLPDSQLRILPDNEQVTNRSADWRHLVTDGGPADQGNCLDSAIFALISSLESTLNAAGGNKTKLSEHQLIDCLGLHLPGASGAPRVCSGRLTMTDILAVLENPAIKLCTLQDYHQFKMEVASGRVPANQCVAPAHPDTRPYVQSHVTVPHENIDEALQNSGPLVVALDASQPTFHFYKSGVYHDLQCSPDSSNFYALLVGHSTGQAHGDQQPSTEAAYSIRASLGPEWGEAGFMRLSSDPQRNKCGPQGVAIYPNIGFE